MNAGQSDTTASASFLEYAFLRWVLTPAANGTITRYVHAQHPVAVDGHTYRLDYQTQPRRHRHDRHRRSAHRRRRVLPTVSTLSPFWAMRSALGVGFEFWWEIGLTCWFICEGPYVRSDLEGLRSHYRAQLADMTAARVPAPTGLFDDLEQAEQRLGPPEPITEPGSTIDIGNGLTITTSIGSGTRRAGFHILRDILTRHRQAWATTHLETAIRAGWEQPLRELAEKINKAVAAKGKLPTARQIATMAAPAANSWFGGDLAATLVAIGERPPAKQIDARVLPSDRWAYSLRLYRALGGRPFDRFSADVAENHPLLYLAADAPRAIQKQELLGQRPTPKEAGQSEDRQWPGRLTFDLYLQTANDALTDDTLAIPTPEQPAVSPERQHTTATEASAPELPVTQSPATQPAQPASQERPTPLPDSGWLPDANQPGVLRWWDGRAWTPFTAPGAGAAPAWFSDPQQTGQLRWWDGRGWTAHTHPA